MRGALAIAGIVAVTSCASRSTPAIRLDGSPRFQNDEGVVTAIDRRHITLDGRRRYRVGPRFVSFSTFTAVPEPMLGRAHQYVLLGTSRRSATWMAGVSAVIGGATPQAHYQGRVVRVDAQRRVVFRDGTVLRLATAVRRPARGAAVAVAIDARRHVVVEVVEVAAA